MIQTYVEFFNQSSKSRKILGGSPGLVVMGGDSRSEDRGFLSQHHILDGHEIFTVICCKNCIVCLKIPKINKKRPGSAHFKKLKDITENCSCIFPSIQMTSSNRQFLEFLRGESEVGQRRIMHSLVPVCSPDKL